MRCTPATGSRPTSGTSHRGTPRSCANAGRARSTAAPGGHVRTSAKKSSPRHPSERRAAWWYRLRGYRVLAANCWVGGYELDLVVRRGRALVFVEVKSKAGDGYGDPLDMVTPVKVERVRTAAAA